MVRPPLQPHTLSRLCAKWKQHSAAINKTSNQNLVDTVNIYSNIRFVSTKGTSNVGIVANINSIVVVTTAIINTILGVVKDNTTYETSLSRSFTIIKATRLPNINKTVTVCIHPFRQSVGRDIDIDRISMAILRQCQKCHLGPYLHH